MTIVSQILNDIFGGDTFFPMKKEWNAVGLGGPQEPRGFQRESNHQSGQSADIYCHPLSNQQTVLKYTTIRPLKNFFLNMHRCLHMLQIYIYQPYS